VCDSPESQKNIFGIQRSLRSSTMKAIKSSSPVFVMICSMSELTCSHHYARGVNGGKIKTFKGFLSFAPSLDVNPLTV